MGRYFWHCPTCNGNFDHGEKCDCEEAFIKKNPQLHPGKESETLIIGFDYGNGEDISCLTIAKKIGDTLTIVNIIHGKEAEQTYEFLLTRGGTVKI